MNSSGMKQYLRIKTNFIIIKTKYKQLKFCFLYPIKITYAADLLGNRGRVGSPKQATEVQIGAFYCRRGYRIPSGKIILVTVWGLWTIKVNL